jgi:asparagine synthase (glutamine-hydrolysing)
MNIDPECKMINAEHKHIRKWVLRTAFDDDKDPFLPSSVLETERTVLRWSRL